jgi:hypothetical protein
MNQLPLASSCDRVRARAVERWDQALSPVEHARDLGHLEVCTGCRAAEAELRGDLRAWSAALGRPTDRHWLEQGLATRLAAAHAPRSSPGPRLLSSRATGAALAAAAALVLLVALAALERFGGLEQGLTSGLGLPMTDAASWWPEVDLPRFTTESPQ